MLSWRSGLPVILLLIAWAVQKQASTLQKNSETLNYSQRNMENLSNVETFYKLNLEKTIRNFNEIIYHLTA